MNRYCEFLILLLVVAGCSRLDTDQQSSPPEEGALPSGALVTGQSAYERACARCHDRGSDGAPAVGDRAAWANRSTLWVAVLEAHANAGYLAMPAKGGDSGLSDQEVAAAAEYMLSLTHPDLPPD